MTNNGPFPKTPIPTSYIVAGVALVVLVVGSFVALLLTGNDADAFIRGLGIIGSNILAFWAVVNSWKANHNTHSVQNELQMVKADTKTVVANTNGTIEQLIDTNRQLQDTIQVHLNEKKGTE